MTENMENTMFSLFYCIIDVTLTRCRHEKYTLSFFFQYKEKFVLRVCIMINLIKT